MDEKLEKQSLRTRFGSEQVVHADLGASSAVERTLLELPELRPGPVMGYLAIRGEPQIDGVLRTLMSRGVHVCVPSVEWDAGTMEPARFTGFEGLLTRRHGVREPAAGTPIVPIQDVRVVLVPGVAFDVHGARLGRGGGFYDRFLERLAPGSIRIGVGFERRVVDRLPVHPWDQMLDMLVTEQAIRRFDRAAE